MIFYVDKITSYQNITNDDKSNNKEVICRKESSQKKQRGQTNTKTCIRFATKQGPQGPQKLRSLKSLKSPTIP